MTELHPETASTSDEQQASRRQFAELFAASPLPPEDLLANILLYARTGLIAKLLVLNEVYEQVCGIPGALCEFGVWWGQNVALLENLRAIHEPHNKQRIILGFDSFAGYGQLSERDRDDPVYRDGTYETPAGYRDYLSALLETHEGMNVLGHVRGNHRLIEGDVQVTVPGYLREHPETIIAFAYFDLALYDPTRATLRGDSDAPRPRERASPGRAHLVGCAW
jgi:hypothetical protein